MKNPLKLYLNKKEEAQVGDPFVMRFNGMYYLYPSSHSKNSELFCYTSKDLVNWSEAILICKDAKCAGGYAPEVIYNDGYFYMCTSPHGKGHYIFKAKSPLGPFKRITENVNNMIDGSFALDSQFNIKFYRANHYGIACNDMDINGNMANRKNLNTHLNGWTEGPGVFYRDNRYYLTCCGNHLESKGYRVAYGVSKSIDKDFELKDYNPLLISTRDEYNSLGHSSTVLAPDLDGYYLVYHHLTLNENENGHYHSRDFGIDRLHFNGSMLSVTPTYFEVEAPKMPDLYEDLSKNSSTSNFRKNKDKYLSNEETGDLFTAEFNFQNSNVKCIVSYLNDDNYILIKGYQTTLSIINIYHGKQIVVVKKDLPINFKNFHTLRVVNSEFKAEFLIDNVSVATTSHLDKGKIGYITDEEKKGLFFTAFSNHALGSSDVNYPTPIPGILDCLHDFKKKETNLDPYDDIYFSNVYEKEVISFKTIQAKKEGYFHMAVLVNAKYSVSLRITSLLEEKVVEFEAKECEYPYYYKDLGFIKVARNDEIKIRINKGVLVYKAFELIEKERDEIKDEKLGIVSKNITNLHQSLDFKFNEFSSESLFGLIFNLNNYSNHPCNPNPSFTGFIVGFRNDLMVVEHVNYGTKRIYDVPCNIKVNKTYHLDAKIIDSTILVLLDGKLIIQTTLPNCYTFGQGGTYVNEFAKVDITNYKEEKDE